MIDQQCETCQEHVYKVEECVRLQAKLQTYIDKQLERASTPESVAHKVSEPLLESTRAQGFSRGQRSPMDKSRMRGASMLALSREAQVIATSRSPSADGA